MRLISINRIYFATLMGEDMKKHRILGVFSLVPSWGIEPQIPP